MLKNITTLYKLLKKSNKFSKWNIVYIIFKRNLNAFNLISHTNEKYVYSYTDIIGNSSWNIYKTWLISRGIQVHIYKRLYSI